MTLTRRLEAWLWCHRNAAHDHPIATCGLCGARHRHVNARAGDRFCGLRFER